MSTTLKRWVIAGYVCPWLIFILVFQGIALYRFAQANQWGHFSLGITLLVSFIGIYLHAFLWLTPSTIHQPLRRTLISCGLLVAIAVAMSWLFHSPALGAMPYILAVWVYRTRIREGVLGVVIGNALLLLLAGFSGQLILSANIAVVSIAMLTQRISIEKSESLVAVSHDLDLSQQREDIARNVHDTVGHYLTATHVKAQLVAKLIERDPTRAATETDEIITLTRRALSEVRGAVEGLSAPELSVELARARTVLSDANIAFTCPKEVDLVALPPATAELFAWVLRETITNIIRHSGATQVQLTMTPTALTVVDNGVGVGGAQPGLGLRSITHRVRSAGGRLDIIDNSPGTIVKAQL